MEGGANAGFDHWPVACTGLELQYLEGGVTPGKLAQAWGGVLSDHRQLTVDIHPEVPHDDMRCGRSDHAGQCQFNPDNRAFSAAVETATVLLAARCFGTGLAVL